MAGRLLGLGDHKATGGIAVETMHQTRRFALLVGQALQHAVKMARLAAAALHGKAVRLVKDIDVFILIKDQVAQEIRVARIELDRFDEVRIVHRRDAHGLSRGHPAVGFDLGLVDFDLAIADQLLQPAKA